MARSEVTESFARGLRVIRAFDTEHPTMTVSEGSERTGLARAVVRRSLRTLVQDGYATEDEGRYRLTPEVLTLGFSYLSGLGLPEVAEPVLRRLSTDVGESSSLGILSHGWVIYVARVAASRIMHSAPGIGARFPAHASSMGRVLMAGLPDNELDDLLGSIDLEALTPVTISDMSDLRTELLRVRSQGWSAVIDELELGVAAVAAPVHDAAGSIVAAVNISMPSGYGVKERLEACRSAVLKSADEISGELRGLGARY